MLADAHDLPLITTSYFAIVAAFAFVTLSLGMLHTTIFDVISKLTT